MVDTLSLISKSADSSEGRIMYSFSLSKGSLKLSPAFPWARVCAIYKAPSSSSYRTLHFLHGVITSRMLVKKTLKFYSVSIYVIGGPINVGLHTF